MINETVKNAIAGARKTKKRKNPELSEKAAVSKGLALMKRSKICLLGTNSGDGHPWIKAMLNLKHEGLKKIWFSTNISSKRIQQLKKDNRACVYYVDERKFQGLLLTGTVEILQDIKSRKMLWTDGAEVYYPMGIEDPDYSVLCFTADKGNFYHGLKNITFDIE